MNMECLKTIRNSYFFGTWNQQLVKHQNFGASAYEYLTIAKGLAGEPRPGARDSHAAIAGDIWGSLSMVWNLPTDGRVEAWDIDCVTLGRSLSYELEHVGTSFWAKTVRPIPMPYDFTMSEIWRTKSKVGPYRILICLCSSIWHNGTHQRDEFLQANAFGTVWLPRPGALGTHLPMATLSLQRTNSLCFLLRIGINLRWTRWGRHHVLPRS